MPEGSKESPAPLDGYLRAAPDEPVFPLQGGDPIAVRVTKVYIWLRRRAALQLANEQKQAEELKRCTAAEEVLWAMQDYLRGVQSGEIDQVRSQLEAGAAIDLHDYRIQCASRLSIAFSEMSDMLERLRELGFDNEAALNTIHNEIIALRGLFNEIEPRPGQRISNVSSW